MRGATRLVTVPCTGRGCEKRTKKNVLTTDEHVHGGEQIAGKIKEQKRSYGRIWAFMGLPLVRTNGLLVPSQAYIDAEASLQPQSV